MSEGSYKFTFTPAPDMLLDKYGPYTALVYGRVRRYCEMQEGICKASRQSIADWLGISVSSVRRNLNRLVDMGYLVDQTPGLKNRPHIYTYTYKLEDESNQWLEERRESTEPISK